LNGEGGEHPVLEESCE